MERMEWAVRAIPLPIPELEEEGIFFCGSWEPFGVTDDTLLVKSEVIVEDEEKSSVHHQLTFGQRYEGLPHGGD